MKELTEEEAGLYIPTIGRDAWRDKPEMAKSLSETAFPMSGVFKFLRKADSFSSVKFRREFLIAEHLRLFEVYPNPGTSLEVVRARCAYRLQHEGHRLTNVTPSRTHRHNYRLIVGRMEDGPEAFKDCWGGVSLVGPALCAMDGNVAKAKIQSVKRVMKRVKRGEKKRKSTPRGVRFKGGLPSAAAIIRWLTGPMKDAPLSQLRKVLARLELKVSDSTIAAQTNRAMKGVLPVPVFPEEVVAKIKEAMKK